MYFLWQNSRSFLAWRSLDLATPKDPQGVEAVLHASVFFLGVHSLQPRSRARVCCSLWWEKRFNEVSGTTPFLWGRGNAQAKTEVWEQNASAMGT